MDPFLKGETLLFLGVIDIGCHFLPCFCGNACLYFEGELVVFDNAVKPVHFVKEIRKRFIVSLGKSA